ncbi:MAG: hypothetical protein AB8B50_09080 [Pirellulaceae bacterium]
MQSKYRAFTAMSPIAISMLLLSMLPNHVEAQINQVITPNGTWKWTSSVGDQENSCELRLEVEGEKVTGTYKDLNVETEIAKGTFKNGELNLFIEAEVQGTDISAELSGKVSDASIKGRAIVDVQGERYGEFDWEPKRSVGKEEVIGTWDFKFTAADGNDYQPVVKITEKETKLVGTISAGGEQEQIDEIKLTDAAFSFAYTADYNGSDLELTYMCSPRGNALTGKINFDVDGNTGEFPIKAERRALSRDAKRMLGIWEFEMETPVGANTSILTLSEVDGKLQATLTGNGQQFEPKHVGVKNGRLRFDFVNEHDGMKVQLDWESKLKEDDTMEGTMQFDAEGNTGEIAMTGKRQ